MDYQETATDDDRECDFWNAVSSNSVSEVKALLATGPVPPDDDTADIIIECSNIETLQALNATGYRFDDYDVYEQQDGTDAVWNMLQHADKQLLSLFIEMGLNVEKDQPGLSYQTFMGIAAQTGDDDMIALLLSVGTDPNVGNRAKHGATPIYYAAKSGHYDCAKLLIDAGCKLDYRIFYITPYERAVKSGHDDIAELIEEAIAQRKAA